MRGFTAVEVMVASTVLVLVLIAVGSLFGQSGSSLQYFTNACSAETTMRRTLDSIVDDVRNAQKDGVIVQWASDYDTVTITRSFGESGVGTVEYKVEGTTSQNPYLVRTQTIQGSTPTTMIVARNLDRPEATGVKSFSVRRVGMTLYTISLRLVVNLSRGDTDTRTFTTTVGTRMQ